MYKKAPFAGAFLLCYTIANMSSKQRRKSLLERAEETALEHIPDKYQKSVVGVFRFGRHLSIIGIFGAIVALFAAFSCCFLIEQFDVNVFVTSLVLLVAMFGLSVLGARYLKFKMSPPSAFGWAIFVGIICFIATGFFGFILVASIIANLASIFGQATMAVIQFIYAVLAILPFILVLDAGYYLFFAHRGYMKWYAGYAKRNHIAKEARIVRKPTVPEDDFDEDL